MHALLQGGRGREGGAAAAAQPGAAAAAVDTASRRWVRGSVRGFVVTENYCSNKTIVSVKVTVPPVLASTQTETQF